MSGWQSEERSDGALMRSGDGVFSQSKQCGLSNERRQRLLQYFNHRTGMSGGVPLQQSVRHEASVDTVELVNTRPHHTTMPQAVYLRQECWPDHPTDNYQPVERYSVIGPFQMRRHHTAGQDRPLSTGLRLSENYHYHGDDVSRHLNSNQKNTRHYKSCNMIGSVAPLQDTMSHQFYQARSVHHIPDGNTCSNNRKYSSVAADRAGYCKGNYSTPNLAISSQGLEYICNFKSPPRANKISNQINGCLMQTRSAQDLSIRDIHGDHPIVLSTATFPEKRRKRKHKNCLIM